MAKHDDKAKDAKGSVWRGVARMEAELQDPDEGATAVYDSRRMTEQARKMIAQQAGVEEEEPEAPTSVRPPEEMEALKNAATSGRKKPADKGPVSGERPKVDGNADPAGSKGAANSDASRDDDDAPQKQGEGARADEAVRADKGRRADERRNERDPIEILAERDGARAPRPIKAAPHKGSSNTMLWLLVILLSIVAGVLAWMRWGGGMP